MSSASLSALMSNYGRMEVAFTRGRGPRLWDSNGREYLDALCGIAVCGLGHAHPDVAAAIADQAASLIHTSNLYRVPLQEQLAAELAELSGLERTFFCNSGAEANEAALKIARRYGHEKGVARPVVIVMHSSFHGRTMATLSATGNPKVHAGFEPLVDGFVHVPFDDVDAVGDAAARADVVALLVEPVQGEGGIAIPQQRYLTALRKLCDERGMLLMIDEVQAGMGRTGRWFGYQHDDIVPDVITLAKALGNGVPIGACVARGAAAEILTPGTHGSTFGGNPLASRAALSVIDVIRRDGLVARAGELGRYFLAGLRQRFADYPSVGNIRAHGLMIGLDMDRPCAALVGLALEKGLLINVTADNVIRLLPPLILSDAEADEIMDRLRDAVDAFLAAAA